MILRNNYRTINHHHGYLVTDNEKNIGFIRISKCGSSTFSNTHSLRKWIKFEEAKDIKIILCSIRDPYSRFLSSIPETLSRLYTEQIPESKFPWTDVSISKDIYLFLANSITSDCRSIIDTFINAIEKFGYFDGHHEPMHNFLLTREGEIEINPLLFLLTDMNTVSNELFKIFNTKPKKINLINSRKENTVLNSNKSFTQILNKNKNKLIENIYSFKFINFIKNNKHPLSRIYDSFSDSFFLNRQVYFKNLYSFILKEFADNKILRQFVKTNYLTDFKIYNSVFSRSSIFNKKKSINNLLCLRDII